MHRFEIIDLQFCYGHTLKVKEKLLIVRRLFQIEVYNSTAEIVVTFVQR